ncbi:ABC transporter ATP-binding protein [Paenibacillus hodogayensis]|uniref:ABC transporter ATP-binding protein n=1 Tax=Paenibacillus hodogayensis TaxID=279208 RepID=A0ABV5W026_9BACL
MNVNSYAAIRRGVVPLLVRIGREMTVLAAVWLALPLLLGALVVPSYAAQKRLIDLFLGGIGGNWRDLLVTALPPLILFTVAELLRVVVTSCQRAADVSYRSRAVRLIRLEVFQRAVGVPLERMDDSGYYDRLRRAESVAGEELLGVLQNVFSLLRLVCELCGLLAVTAMAGPYAALALTAVFIVSFWIRLESDVVKRRLNRDLTASGRHADDLREAIAKPETIRDMRIGGSMKYLIDRWAGLLDHSLVQRGNANRREIRRGIVVSTVQIAGLFGTILLLILQLKSGGMTAGMLVIVLQAMRQTYHLSGTAAFPVGKIYIQSAKIADLAAFLGEPAHLEGNEGRRLGGTECGGTKALDVPDGEAEYGGPKTLSVPYWGAEYGGPKALGVQYGQAEYGGTQTLSVPYGAEARSSFAGVRVELEDVSYRYAGADELTLHGVSLTVKLGETVALVGENGAGKSTLAKLLLGLYQPTGGRMTWDGEDCGTIDRTRFRRSTSAVFQDFVRFETTLRDNVAFGVPGETLRDEAVCRALQTAGAEELERELLDAGGLDGRVGLVAAGGRGWSGGQWQRLALARAAVREARLLVLDEPTAALDPQHESELYHSFRRLASGRTVLFVSHRLGWARFADRIVVLRDGRIVEEGTHDTLMQAGGEYAAMFRTQAEWYRG